jgi:ATP-binding cassette subfamily C protein CydD
MSTPKQAARAWMRSQMRAGRRAAAPVIVCGLMNTCFAVLQAFCVATILAQALTRQPGFSWRWVAGFALLGLLRAGLGVVSERSAARAGAVARQRLRADALARLLSAGPALTRSAASGELAATLVDRIEALDGLFARWLPASMVALGGPALVLIGAGLVDLHAAFVLLLAGMLVPIGMAIAGIGAARASGRQFLALARLQTRFLDRVRGIATIVLNGRAQAEAASLARAADELRARTMRVLRVAFLSSAVLDCAAAAALIVLALRYGSVLVGGRSSPTELAHALFALLLVPEFFAPLRAYALAYQDRLQASGAAEALLALPPLPEPAPPMPIRHVTAHGLSVAFEDVSLSWDPERGPALDGLSFRLAAGETMVLAGPSGSGKTTVLEVLLGFVRPDAGRVLINGADIASIVPQALARMTAWIGQRPVLFAGSIADNIRFARPDASDAEIADAARAARLDALLSELPEGIDTVVGEAGYGLSGGQAQRVAIARAYLKNAPLLLLDEPTAHLDPATEQEVFDSLQRLAIGRTVILASHSAAAHGFGGRRLDIRAGRAVHNTRLSGVA